MEAGVRNTNNTRAPSSRGLWQAGVRQMRPFAFRARLCVANSSLVCCWYFCFLDTVATGTSILGPGASSPLRVVGPDGNQTTYTAADSRRDCAETALHHNWPSLSLSLHAARPRLSDAQHVREKLDPSCGMENHAPLGLCPHWLLNMKR